MGVERKSVAYLDKLKASLRKQHKRRKQGIPKSQFAYLANNAVFFFFRNSLVLYDNYQLFRIF